MVPIGVHSQKLGYVISNHKNEIVENWVKEIFSLSTFNDNPVFFEELKIPAAATIVAFVEYLINPANKGLLQFTSSNFLQSSNAKPADVIAIVQKGKKVVLPFTQMDGKDEKDELNLQLDNLLCDISIFLTQSLSDKLVEQLNQANKRITLITDLVHTVGSTLDLSEVLSEAGKAITSAVGTDNCFFYLVSNEFELQIALPHNMPWPNWIMPDPNYKQKLEVGYLSNKDAVWDVIKEKVPIKIYDAQNDPRTSHVEEIRTFGIKSFLLIPCLSKGQVIAVAVITSFDKNRLFTSEEVELTWAIANIVAPGIENARFLQRVEQLAGLEERARLAREMHDSLAQNLSAMQLKASQMGNLLQHDQIELASKNLEELNFIAKEAYTDVREAIFHLRSQPPSGKEYLAFLRDYLTTYQTCFHISVDLIVEGDPTASLSENMGDHIFHIIQEAITNIRKHAHASNIKIGIKRIGYTIQVEIKDNGIGFDPILLTEDQKKRHFGLQIMQERAEEIGGTITVDSQPDHGTLVRFMAPITMPQFEKMKEDQRS